MYSPKLSLEGLTGTDMFDSLMDPIAKDINIAEGVPLIFGIVNDFRPNIKELKVFNKKGRTQVDAAKKLNNQIMNLKEEFISNPTLKMVKDLMFGKGFPMVPFPDVERCLGLNAKDSTMRIEDGFAIMAFDYDVTATKENCIFDMRDSLSKKELRMAKKNKNKGGFDLNMATRKLQKTAK